MGDPTAWLRRFTPALHVREDDGAWVTDRFRIHRAPPEVVAFLDAQAGGRALSCRIDWDGDVPELTPMPPLPVDSYLGQSLHAYPVRLRAADHDANRAVFVTGDAQDITVDATFLSQARDDGAVTWTGTSPLRPLFGYTHDDELVVVIAPMKLE